MKETKPFTLKSLSIDSVSKYFTYSQLRDLNYKNRFHQLQWGKKIVVKFAVFRWSSQKKKETFFFFI